MALAPLWYLCDNYDQLGEYNELSVLRKTPQGLYVGDEEGSEVLLPWKFVPNELNIGDDIEVFIYKDHLHRLIATTRESAISLNTFAFLRVKALSEYGAFVDWGLEKDLLVPFREQNKKMREGRSYLIYLYVDDQTDRLVGSAKVRKFLDNSRIGLAIGEEVEVILWERTDLGMRVIVNHQHEGLVYHNEIFDDIRLGEKRKGYVKKIREDSKLDISLQVQGFQNTDLSAEKILKALKASDGFLPLHDKSSPDLIKQRLQMSKKTFKKSVGALYKRKQIILKEDGIYLKEQAKP